MPMQYCFQPFLRYLGFVSPTAQEVEDTAQEVEDTAQEVEDTAKTDVSQYFNVVAGCNYCCKSMC